jgi:hypothetical protein
MECLPSTVAPHLSNQEKDVTWGQLEDETYQAWLNQPPIQFPLHVESSSQNVYNNTSSSHVGDKDNNMEVGMDDFLQNIHATE